MRTHSLNTVTHYARVTLNRFPLSILSGICFTMAMISIVESHENAWQNLRGLSHLAMVSALGIPLFFALAVFIEDQEWEPIRRAALQASGFLVLAVFYFFWLPNTDHSGPYYRYSMFNAAVHLLVAVAPFLFLNNYRNAFWQYNKSLFLRFIESMIYSVTLYVGLALAIVALNYLFNLKIDEKFYAHLWFIVVGTFNTWFFLAGVPQNIRGLEQVYDYPKGLKVFTQFILIPLLTIYLIILYLYLGKIILQWDLPRGGVSWFVIAASTFGILSLLLVYPISEKNENTWIKTYARYFYLALFPLIMLMAFAIGRRIFDYGITVERYFVLIFTVWLSVIAVCFTVNPKTNIKIIPLSLMLLFAATLFGPWGALEVSKSSQMSRLKKYLIAGEMFKSGKLNKATALVLSKKDVMSISSILQYLHSTYGLEILTPWLSEELKPEYKEPSAFLWQYLGLKYVYPYEGVDDRQSFYFGSHLNGEVQTISGFDYLSEVNNLHKEIPQIIKIAPGDVILTLKGESLRVAFKGEEMTIALRPLIEPSSDSNQWYNYDVPIEKMTVDAEGKNLKVKVFITYIQGVAAAKEYSLGSLAARVLLKVK